LAWTNQEYLEIIWISLKIGHPNCMVDHYWYYMILLYYIYICLFVYLFIYQWLQFLDKPI
jgi:hypothetical protein